MDWALVLASQNIEATITRLEDGAWGLAIHPQDETAALGALRQYHVENRGWGWTQPVPGSGLVFHWGAAGWAAAVVAVYYLCEVRSPWLERAGVVDTAAIRHGQWWRLFTAISLHENLPHLMANLTSGFLLLGLAMARYGAGVALLSAFLAGAVGNLAGFHFYSDHTGLGASGMVMAALGLLAAPPYGAWRRHIFVRGGASAVLILILTGFGPGTDTVAHVGGFVGGACLGAALSFAPPERLQTGYVNVLACAGVIGLAWWTWQLAF
jgi:membrane associated rhomboid family serine protease